MIDKYMYHKYCYTYRVSYQSSDDKYNQTMRRNGFYIHMGDGKRREVYNQWTKCMAMSWSTRLVEDIQL